MARLFLAIWPPDDVRAALARLAQDVSLVAEGRPIEASKIHLTLAFLGEVDQAGEERIREVASAVRAPRFTLALDRVGSFRRSRVAWAGASEVPEALVQLQEQLSAGLRSAAFALEDRPFRPHITLARKTARPLPSASVATLAMECDAIALVVSNLATGKYSTVESWPLG